MIVAIHDVVPQSLDAVRSWRAIVSEHVEGPVALLVVPRDGGWATWRDEPGAVWLRERAAAGDEVVLHGWTHTTPAGHHGPEFAGRSYGEMTERLCCGMRDLAGVGLTPKGVITPCYVGEWRADVIDVVGIEWMATRWLLRWATGGRPLPSLGVGASTPLKRATSVPALGSGSVLVRPFETVRLDLHPADLDHPALFKAGLSALRRLVEQGRCLATHTDLTAADPGA